MNNRARPFAIAFCLLLLAGPAQAAPGLSNWKIDGNVVHADIAVGSVAATLTLRFEDVVGLTPANLGVTVKLVDPLSLVGRLGSGIALPAAFPLVVKISPPEGSGLSFSGVVGVELYTHNLLYTIGSPLRLYSAPDGGTFTDITTFVGSGSVRSGGTKPTFSEFIIAVDLRPLNSVITTKFSDLGGILNQHVGSLNPAVQSELLGLYNAAANAWAAGQIVAAITYLEAFDDQVVRYSGRQIPDVWRSSGDLTNVAGSLRAAAATLRYSLTLASNAS